MQPPKADYRASEKEIKMTRSEKMIEKFGKEIEALEGFAECLARENFKDVTFTSGHTGEVISAKVCGAIGLFIAEESRWESRGGLGKKTIVGVYRNGKTSKQTFQFIDQLDARKDNYKLQFEKLDVESICYERVTLKACSKNGNISILQFKITGSENEKNEKEKEFDSLIEESIKEKTEIYREEFPKLEVKVGKVNYLEHEAEFSIILDPQNPDNLDDPKTPGYLTVYRIKKS